MRLLPLVVVAISGLSVTNVVGQSLGPCGAETVTIANTTIIETSKSVETVTVTHSPISLFKEINGIIPAYASAASVDLENLSANFEVAPTNPTPTIAANQSNTTGITGTSTIFYTYTQTVQVVYNTPNSTASYSTQTSTASFRGNKAVFYYASANDSTVWLNGVTPKSSGGVEVTGQTTVMVSPLPTLVASAGTNSSVDQNETPHSTTTLTRTISNLHTSTIPWLSLNATASSTSFTTATVTAIATPKGYNAFLAGDSPLSLYQPPSNTSSGSSVTASPITTTPINSSVVAITTHHPGPTPQSIATPTNGSAIETGAVSTPDSSSIPSLYTSVSSTQVNVLPTNVSDSDSIRSKVTVTSTSNGWGVFYSVGSPKGPMTPSANISGLIGSATIASSTANSRALTADASAYRNRYLARKARRQVGAPVVATINGKVVTWINHWDGEKTVSTSTPAVSTSSSTSKQHSASDNYAPFIQGHATLSKLSSTISSEAVRFTPVSSKTAPSGTSKLPKVAINPNAGPKDSSLVLPSEKPSSAEASQPSSSTVVTSVVQVAKQSITLTTFKTSVSSSRSSQVAPFANFTCTKCKPSSVSSLLLPTATTCGEVGPFTLDFDDLPTYSPGDNNTANFPPIFNPYHHFYFAAGFAYAPPPTDPFPPISPPYLAVFIPPTGLNDTVTDSAIAKGSPDAGDLTLGEFGAGPRASDSAFHFNVSSAYIGCDNSGPDSCNATVTGLTWNQTSQQEIIYIFQSFEIPPCPGFLNCSLTRIDLSGFNGLSGLSIFAQVANRTVMWFVDEIEVDWANNTCAAGLERQMSR